MSASTDDRESILAEIDRTIEEQRTQFRETIADYSATRSGAGLPVLVNIAAIVAVAVTSLVLWRTFLGDESAYVLQAAGGRALDTDIVAALLAEAEDALGEKEAQIGRLQTEIDRVNARLEEIAGLIQERLTTLRSNLEEQRVEEPEIDARVAAERDALEGRYADERAQLQAQREDLSEELALRIQEQEALLAQVNTQRRILEEDRGNGTGTEAGSELEQLAQQRELQELFDQRLLSGYRSFSDAAESRNWSEAGATLADMETFLTGGGVATGNAEARSVHAATVGRLQELVTIAAEGWPEDETEDLLPGWNDVRGQIEQAQAAAATGNTARAVALYREAMTEIPGLGGGVGLLTADAQERSVTAISQAVARSETIDRGDPEELLATLTGELSDSPDVPAAVVALTDRLQVALEAVAAQREELRRLTELSRRQLELLRQSVADSGEEPAGDGANIDALQERVAETRARQQRIENENAALRAEVAELTSSLRDTEEVLAETTAFVDRVRFLSRQYRQRTSGIRGDVPTGDREPVQTAMDQLISSVDTETGRELFPDLSVTLRTLVSALVDLESERAAAEAEAQVLLEVQSATERVTEEQMRLLAFSENTDQDTMELLDTLVNEIDTLAVTRRRERQDTDYAQALGVIVSADPGDGTMVVQRATTVDFDRVSRVFVNRVLPNGDRIPIADVRVVATSGGNTIIETVSTIAPTISPEVNDIVYVEF